MKTSIKRLLSLMMAFALTVTTVLTSDVTTAYAASSSKTVKSVTLKIGTKNVTKKTTKMYVKDTATVKVTVNPSKAKKSVTFKSNKTSVATVSSKGKITAKKAGTAKVTVTVKGKDNKSKSTYVNVKVQNRPVTSVKLSATKISLKKGASKTLKATVSPSNATVKTVKWSSNKTSVATVNSKGKVTAKAAGTAVITAKSGSKSAKCTVVVTDNTTVSVPVTGVTISQSELVLAVNATSPLKATVTPDNATNKQVVWSSSDASVATVDNTGNVKGVASGTAKISVTTVDGGFSKECTVTVKDSISVTGVTLSKTSLDVAVNATSSLTATVTPDNAVNKAVTWSSANPAVATVDQNGNVKGVTVGTTTVKVTTTEGGFSAECTVNVKAATNKNASKVEIEITNDIDGYENAVFTGTDAHVRVRALDEDGSPVGNTEVKLDSTCQRLGNGDGMFGIRSDDVAKTDADGYVTFVVGLLPQYSSYTAVDQYCESYLLKATVVGSSVNSSTTLSFGYIDLRGTVVENNRDLDPKNDITPSDNAVAGDDGIFTTHCINGFRKDEYVNSQQVSRRDTDEHAVTISAAPYLVIPSTAGDISSDRYQRDINATSTDYSVYNDIDNENTTTVIEGVPAGLQYATLNFSNVKLSEYTKIDIETYNAVTGALIESYQMYKDSNTNDVKTTASYQLPIQRDVDIDVKVSIVSEGQVNDDLNDGYTIKDITGLWASTSGRVGVYKELEGTVSWEKVDTIYSNAVDITLEDVKQYIPADSQYLNEKYTYKYEVPVFPYTGDAIITVNDENKGVVAYYLYPTVNDYEYVVDNRGNYVRDDFGDYVKEYQNRNVLPTNKILEYTTKNYYDEYEGAIGILASSEEINYSKSVGDITTDGNNVIVNSYVSGITGLKATVKVDGLTSNQLNPTNGSELYTSVNWAPIPNEELEADDFYALLGQNVTVTAQLLDDNGNAKKESGSTIDFTYNTVKNGTKIEATDVGKELGDTGVTLVLGTRLTTDENGQAKLILKSSDYSKFITNIQATCERYNVKIIVGPQKNLEDDEYVTKLADIYWVDAGLQFADKVEANSKPVEPKVWNSWTNTNITLQNGDIDDRSVGSHWIFGYEVVGRVGVLNRKVLDITNIPVNMSKDSIGEMVTEGCENGVAKLYSEKVGTTNLRGEITNEAFDEAKQVVFNIEKGIETKEYNNVGEGTPTIKSSITIPVSWKTVGLNISIESPLGTALDKNTSTYAYIKVADKFGNPISSREVTYSVTGLNAKEITKATTNDKGLIEIPLPSPSADWTATTYTTTINASTDDDQIVASPCTLQYSESKATKFGLVNARYDASKSTENVDVIVATFSVPVRVINKALFTVRAGGTVYEVTSAEVDSSDKRNVILTLANNGGAIGKFQEATDVTVSVAEEVIDQNDGMRYKAVDENGTTVTSGYASIKFVRPASYSIVAEYVASEHKFKISIKNGAIPVEFNGDEIVAVADVASVFTEGAAETGIKRGTGNNVTEITLDANPTDANSTIRIYYNGVVWEDIIEFHK
ncbi:MAG: Ig-like domain-containing protein [Lachnospiraceae bacterium]|nr:Ig-like domain-containing protein [Lachnospiraceae bacterium]MDE6252668.1 Ig-like domain-containing protein [Lachnospiraceae bacterium]